METLWSTEYHVSDLLQYRTSHTDNEGGKCLSRYVSCVVIALEVQSLYILMLGR